MLGQNVPNEMKKDESLDMVNLTIRAAIDCSVHCDGDFLFTLEAGKIENTQAPVGQHLFEFKSLEDDEIIVEKEVDFPEIKKNYLVNVRDQEFDALFKAKNAKMAKEKVAKEEEARHKAEEERKQRERESEELVRKGKDYFANHEYELAMKSYKIAAEFGNPEAQYLLGRCYVMEGATYEKYYNYNEGVKWLKKSAEQGFVDAQLCLGHVIADDLEDDEKVKEGMKWIEMAAEQGYSEAQYDLGSFYATDGLSVYDRSLAIKWFKAASDQGNLAAERALGHTYMDSHDYDNAYKVFSHLAQIGDEDYLGSLRQAVVDNYDYNTAIEWYKKIGDEDSISYLKKKKEEEEKEIETRKKIEKFLKYYNQ